MSTKLTTLRPTSRISRHKSCPAWRASKAWVAMCPVVLSCCSRIYMSSCLLCGNSSPVILQSFQLVVFFVIHLFASRSILKQMVHILHVLHLSIVSILLLSLSHTHTLRASFNLTYPIPTPSLSFHSLPAPHMIACNQLFYDNKLWSEFRKTWQLLSFKVVTGRSLVHLRTGKTQEVISLWSNMLISATIRCYK